MAINTVQLVKEIREKGRAECPWCHKGYLVARSDIPTEKQLLFTCSNCKEKLYLRKKFKF